MTKEQFLGIEGFKAKMTEKIYSGILDKLQSVSIVTLAAVSNTMGRGFSEKKIRMIYDAHHDVFTNKSVQDAAILSKIKGVEQKTAQLFVDNIPHFLKFLEECKLTHKLHVKHEKVKIREHILNDKTIVITGLRDKELEERLKEIGVKIGSNISKNTHLLLVKNLDVKSSKVEEAKKLGIEIMEVDKFQI